MSIHHRTAAILAVLAIAAGPFPSPNRAQAQNAQLASCGTPACGSPNCGGSIYSTTPYGGCSSSDYSTLPYGGQMGGSFGTTSDTAYLYHSGYQGGGHMSPSQLGGGCQGTGFSGPGTMSGTGMVYTDGYSDGYSVAGASGYAGSTASMSTAGNSCGNGQMIGDAAIGGAVLVGGGAGYGNACGPADVASMPTFGSGRFGNFAPGFYGGFEFLWLRANFGQNVALIIDPPVGNTLVPFDYEHDLSPRAWLGWQSCRGTGVRFTYFSFDDEPDPVSVTAVVGATPVFVNVFGAGSNLTRNANANAGETLTSQHELKLQTYDIEATQQFCFASTQAMFGLGVRVAEMNQLLRGDVHDGGGVLQEAVTNDLDFAGAGPTASLWLTRQIMCSRFSFYSNMRGAFLIGDTDQRIYEMKGAYTTELEDRAIHREILTNAECSVGLQFGQSLTPRCGCFLRVGYEAQVWLDAGGPVNSDSSIGLDGVTFATGLAL
ncbi:hypothetical protein [Rhodopirellula sp. SWK7]|uniref:hypothetical protein n=1 Tax=Rhodopirellula sp. SWK7 TaxID=595460 RepID=UPI001F1CC158|nr:hypothetical protein [Rhodopirellula sp. SWK7]